MKIKKQIIFLVLFFGAAIIAVFYGIRYPQFFFGRGRQVVSSVRFPARDVGIFVEVARTPYQWGKGLMFVEHMPDNQGMLFVFPDSAKRSFWMKDTLIPLDMLFISADKKIVTIQKNAMPCTTLLCSHYASTVAAMYVLEVNAGFADNYGIKEGDVIEF